MEKHIDIQNTNILNNTGCNQQSVNNEVRLKNEVENNNECIKEEFTDMGFNIDKYEHKHNNSNFW